MKCLLPVLLGLTSLGACQSPTATSGAPLPLLGHWQCDTVVDTWLTRAGQPALPADTSRLDELGASLRLDITPTHLSMPMAPDDTAKWTYTYRADSLFVHSILGNRPPQTAAEYWHLTTLTPTTLVIERDYEEGAGPRPLRIQWRYHR